MCMGTLWFDGTRQRVEPLCSCSKSVAFGVAVACQFEDCPCRDLDIVYDKYERSGLKRSVKELRSRLAKQVLTMVNIKKDC